MTVDNPPGATENDELQLEAAAAKDNTITDLLLGVVNWWWLKGGKNEVVNLVMRHFELAEVYKSSCYLAETCGLSPPTLHKNSSNRPALEPSADDLVTRMRILIDSKRLPMIVIPANELGKVPLEAVSDTGERSVSARLESLEECVKGVVSAVDKLSSMRINPATSLAPIPAVPGVSITPAQGPGQTFADIARKHVQARPDHHGGGAAQGGGLPPGQNRQRSRSPQVKRDYVGEEVGADGSGYRRQGRPRHQNRPAAAVWVNLNYTSFGYAFRTINSHSFIHLFA